MGDRVSPLSPFCPWPAVSGRNHLLHSSVKPVMKHLLSTTIFAPVLAAVLAPALALSLAACSSEPAPAPEPSDSAAGQVPLSASQGASTADPMTLSPAGLGALAFGAAPPAGSGWQDDDVQLSDSCHTLHSADYRESYAMSDGSVIRRITVSMGSPVTTAKHIGPGASEADVRKAYPYLEEEPHKYVAAPAKYLTWLPQGGGPGLRFEIDQDGIVSLIHAGEMPWLGYVEGCA